MNVELIKEYRFEAAHRLPMVPPGHKCQRLHGHSFRIEVACAGPVDPKTGWFIDYGDIDAIWEPLYRQLDHNLMNEIEGLENPTSENLARWLFDRFHPKLPGLTSITVFETADARCVYRGPGKV